MSPSLHLTERNRTAVVWPKQSRFVQSREGNGQKIGEKQHEY
jgi:hypothetical protein